MATLRWAQVNISLPTLDTTITKEEIDAIYLVASLRMKGVFTSLSVSIS